MPMLQDAFSFSSSAFALECRPRLLFASSVTSLFMSLFASSSGEGYNGPRKPDRKTGEVKSKTMVQRRNFSSEFKTKVVLELLREEETVSQIAAKHKIHHSVLKKWKNTATEGLPGLFADPRKKSAEEIDTESTISDLYKQVGLLSMQLEWLKKKMRYRLFLLMSAGRS